MTWVPIIFPRTACASTIRSSIRACPTRIPIQPLDFLILDQFNYKADTQTFSVGLESTQWERYLFSVNYSLMLADGYNANGLAGQSLAAGR